MIPYSFKMRSQCWIQLTNDQFNVYYQCMEIIVGVKRESPLSAAASGIPGQQCPVKLGPVTSALCFGCPHCGVEL